MVFAIEAGLGVKLCLVNMKYWLFMDASCDHLNATAALNTSVEPPTEDPGYLVAGKHIRTGSTVHVLLFLFTFLISALNMHEYVQLAYGTYKYLSDSQKPLPTKVTPEDPKPLRKPWCSWLAIFVIFFFLCLVPLLKFSVGVIMEVQKSGCIWEASSGGNLSRIYVAYCCLELLNAVLLACTVRVLMVWQTIKIRSVWFTDTRKAPKKHTENESFKKEAEKAWLAERQDYERRGKEVKRMMTPFKWWFLTPWIMFLVMTLINPHTLLTPWTRYEDSKLLSMSQVYYLLLVVLKAFQVFTQNACVMAMNNYHQEYYRKMTRRFMKGFTQDVDSTPKYQEEAKEFFFVFNEKFSFHPNFLCINARIDVDTPYFVLCLILGIFVSSSDILFR